MNYVVVGQHQWNYAVFADTLKRLPGRWYYLSDKKRLTLEEMNKIKPEYIFFLHWSEIVPNELVNTYDCVCFHPSHLPYGRGGTPIQNLILRGFKETQLTAFKMTDEIDAGPIYYQEPLSLAGSLSDIFNREMRIAADIIKRLISENPIPDAQKGVVERFYRLSPVDSEVNYESDLTELYDKIRMLDAPGYPAAFMLLPHLKINLFNAQMVNGKLKAVVEIEERND